MNGGGSFHCIPDVDDDCISDSQVKTHVSLLFLKCFHSTTITSNKNTFHKIKRDIQGRQIIETRVPSSLYLCNVWMASLCYGESIKKQKIGMRYGTLV